MGFMDKAKDLAGQHDEKIDQGIEQGGDMVDERTGGKHAEHVDKAQDFANDRADQFGGVEGGDEPQQDDNA